MTLEDLAGMVKQGFDEMQREMKSGFDRIENYILPDHRRRIEHLEVDMKRVKDIFAVK